MTTLDAQRAVTAAFIAEDPTEIELIPQVETISDGGGRVRVLGTPRAAQTFKLIPMTYDQRPTVTAGGVERTIDYTLLGAWDCDAEVWDIWMPDETEYYLVVAVSPGHGYERKLLVERHLGRDGLQV